MSREDIPRLQDLPREGDVYGEPAHGHRVETIHAAVLIQADGSEGLLSSYTFDAAGRPTGSRVTFVTSNPGGELQLFKRALAQMLQNLPAGARVEWREYTRAK